MQKEEFEIIDVTIKDITHKEWKNIPEFAKPKIEDIGKRVLLADRQDDPERFFLYRVHQKGERFWSEYGGYTVKTESGYTRTVHENMCRLHPISID
jgi:hypothetical protein